MAKKTFTFKAQLDPAEFKRLSRDAIKSEIQLQLMEQVHAVAERIDDTRRSPKLDEVVVRKDSKQLGSLGH